MSDGCLQVNSIQTCGCTVRFTSPGVSNGVTGAVDTIGIVGTPLVHSATVAAAIVSTSANKSAVEMGAPVGSTARVVVVDPGMLDIVADGLVMLRGWDSGSDSGAAGISRSVGGHQDKSVVRSQNT